MLGNIQSGYHQCAPSIFVLDNFKSQAKRRESEVNRKIRRCSTQDFLSFNKVPAQRGRSFKMG